MHHSTKKGGARRRRWGRGGRDGEGEEEEGGVPDGGRVWLAMRWRVGNDMLLHFCFVHPQCLFKIIQNLSRTQYGKPFVLVNT